MEKVKCFFNFRGPYDVNSFAVTATLAALKDKSYVNNYILEVKKAIEENIDMEFFPLCYMPKEIVEFFVKASGNEYKRSYLYLDCDRLFQ